MEQKTNVVASTVEGKQNNGNGLKIATVIACVAVVCGIGFGVYGMMQSMQKDAQISDLKVQIKEASGTVTTIETPEIETSTNDGTTVNVTDTAVDDYKKFADNLAKNNNTTVLGYFYHWTGAENVRKTVMSRIENTHLTITELGEVDKVIAEADGIISAYYIEIGNGGVPYMYLIKKDGGVARIELSENSARTIENLDGYGKIVSILGGGDLCAYLIDINGNMYKNY